MTRLAALIFSFVLAGTEGAAQSRKGSLWYSSQEEFREFMKRQGLVTEVVYGPQALFELQFWHVDELEDIKDVRDYYTARGRFIGLYHEGIATAQEYADNIDTFAYVRQHEALHAYRNCTGKRSPVSCIEEIETLNAQYMSANRKNWSKDVLREWEEYLGKSHAELLELQANGTLEGNSPRPKTCPPRPTLDWDDWNDTPSNYMRRGFSKVIRGGMRAHDIYSVATDPVGTAVDEVTNRVISKVVPHPAVLLPGSGIIALGGPQYAQAAKNVLVDEAFRGSAEYRAAFATLRGPERNSPLSSRQQRDFFGRISDVIYRYDNNISLDESDYSFINSVPWEFPEELVNAAR